MISFITCSIDPTQLKGLRHNLAETAGVEYELIAHDNREAGWGLARAYNHGAGRARYPLLCFVHEDVRFRTPGFGAELVRFYAATPGAGLVGFAGSKAKSRAPSGWSNLPQFDRRHVLQHGRSGAITLQTAIQEGTPYTRVLTLDGMAFFAPAAIWRAHRFDEQTFPGFHGYDLDFSTTVALAHPNFVCQAVLAEHFSPGSFNPAWAWATEAYHRKWADRLPLACVELDEAARESLERTCAYRYYRDRLEDPSTPPPLIEAARRHYLPHATLQLDFKIAKRQLRRWLRRQLARLPRHPGRGDRA